MAAHIEILDGFEDYPGVSTAGVGLASYWNAIGAGGISLVTGRVGGQAVRMTQQSVQMFRVLEAANEKSWFFAFNTGGSWGSVTTDYKICELTNGSNVHISIRINYLRELIVIGGDGAELVRVADMIHTNTWYSLSVAWKGSTSTGTLQIRVNGELVVDMTNANTQHSSSPNANRVYFFGGNNIQTEMYFTYDDVRVDTETTTPIAEGRYAIVTYDADDSVQFTPLSGSDNYLMIDDPTCDQDTTYNASNTVGHRDVFTVNALPFDPDRIMAIQLTLIARKEDVATRRVKSILISDSTEVDGDDMYLSTDYTINRFIIQNDPATGIEFTKGGLAAVKPGYELVE